MGETCNSADVAVWWETGCWNGLSREQQMAQRITNHHEGEPRGWCRRMAEVAITTRADAAPGPRLYCKPCAVVYLATGDWGR